MLIALAQLNPVVGDIPGNAGRILHAAAAAKDAGADLLVTPEQSLVGYPAEDLLLRESFLADAAEALCELAAQLPLPTVVGWPEFVADEQGSSRGAVGSFSAAVGRRGRTFNAASLIGPQTTDATIRKSLLPNYGVFDEARYFSAGDRSGVVGIGGVRVGITVCEDIWHEHGPHRDCVEAGAALVVNLSASPYSIGRPERRCELVARRARELGVPVALCNLVGGQDDLVFDGTSVVARPDGSVAVAPSFVEGILLVDVEEASGIQRFMPLEAASSLPGSRAVDGGAGEVWAALALALRDYVAKNGLPRVFVGLSGGIDSAVVATLAADALDAGRVVAATMPSRHSSQETRADAIELAARLGIELHELPIADAHTALVRSVQPALGGDPRGVADENLQARIRGMLLMALANHRGGMVLTTGNKSEVSVGYMTLYGDMAGGFAPLKDVPKTMVWELARWRNGQAPAPIPQSTIERPPTAELRPGQRDDDSLPSYEVLDPILALYVDEERSVDQIVAAGHDRAVVERVAQLVDGAEHKRRQAAPGPRVSLKAFGRERRLPVTNGYRHLTRSVGSLRG